MKEELGGYNNDPRQPGAIPKVQFVIEYDPATGGIGFSTPGGIPHLLLVGALELAKTQVLGAQMAAIMQQEQQQAAKKIVIPNGRMRI